MKTYRPSSIKVCPICKREFRVYAFEAEKRKTCSQKCRGEYLHLLKVDAPCARCKIEPRVKGRSYCSKCDSELSMISFRKREGWHPAKRLTDEERHQYKKQKQARYREQCRDRLNERQRRYYHTHYEISVRGVEKRRALKLGCETSLTASQWNIIKAIYGYRCAYCGRKPKVLTKDHITPLSKGGGHTANNIVPACRSCNSRKHIASPPNFQPILAWHFEEILK